MNPISYNDLLDLTPSNERHHDCANHVAKFKW